MRERRDTANETHGLYSSGFRLTNMSIRLLAAVTTPRCWSFSKWIILVVHSPVGIMSGLFLISLRRHRAALCFTESSVSLYIYIYKNVFQTSARLALIESTNPETSSFGISWANVSAISLLPILAIHCKARLINIGFLDCKSFLIFWMMSFIRSLSWFSITEMNRYPFLKTAKLNKKDTESEQVLLSVSRCIC